MAIRFISFTLSELLAVIKLSFIFIAPAPLPIVKRPLEVIAPLPIVPMFVRFLEPSITVVPAMPIVDATFNVLFIVTAPLNVPVPILDRFLPPEITSVPPICSPSLARLSFPSAAKVKYLYAPLVPVRIEKAFVADSYK